MDEEATLKEAEANMRTGAFEFSQADRSGDDERKSAASRKLTQAAQTYADLRGIPALSATVMNFDDTTKSVLTTALYGLRDKNGNIWL